MTLVPGTDEAADQLRAELRTLAARLERLEAASAADVAELRQVVERVAHRCELLIEVSDLVHGQVVARLDQLEAGLEDVRASRGREDLPQRRPQDGTSPSYADTVSRVRELVVRLTPPGATVAVVGKGDPALVDIEGRVGWHFPRSPDGRYLGYYPGTDADALAMLEEVRLAGAGYLVFPATSFWWLEHYRGLSDHLHEHHAVVVRDTTSCAIFRLTGDAAAVPSGPSTGVFARQVRDLVDRLVPADEPVAVATADLLTYHPWMRAVVPFPLTVDADELRSATADLLSGGVRHVVIPYAPAGDAASIVSALVHDADTLIDQRQVCAVLRLIDNRDPDGSPAIATP